VSVIEKAKIGLQGLVSVYYTPVNLERERASWGEMEAHNSLTSFRTTRGHSSSTPGLSSLQEAGVASVRNTAPTIRTIPSENARVSRTQHSSALDSLGRIIKVGQTKTTGLLRMGISSS
jgi:hypothetical protein